MIEELMNVGFTKNEAKVYSLLSKEGDLSAPKIANILNIDRRTVYDTLNHLLKKGKVSKRSIQNKDVYSSTDIELINKEIYENYLDFKKIIPELKKSEKEKSKVNILLGLNAIKILVNKALEEKDEILLLGRGGYLAEQLKNSKYQYVPKLAKLNWRMIQTSDYSNNFFKPKSIRFLPENVTFETAFLTFSDKVYLFSKSEEIMLIEIIDKNFSKTFKEYFNIFWKISKEKK
jgi:sugar-specific transcriptional regulator TrmB